MRLRLFVGLALLLIVGWFAAPYFGIDPRSLWITKAVPTARAIPSISATEEPPSLPKLDVFDDRQPFEDGGFQFSDAFTGVPKDEGSLDDLRQAVDDRVKVGLSVLGGELDQLMVGPNSTKEELVVGRNLYQQFGLLAIYSGRLEEATLSFQRASQLAGFMDASTKEMLELRALLGIVAMRRGEVENDLGKSKPLSLQFPIPIGGIQSKKSGSREAIRHFQDYLKDEPRDLRVRWLLNMAYMKVGDYPAKVPSESLIPIAKSSAGASAITFQDFSIEAGLMDSGANLGGVGLFDDFDGDSLPDLVLGTLNTDFGATFYHNKGDGGFEERSDKPALQAQVYVRNGTAADFDNDGKLDVFFVRGGGEKPYRPTLLKNLGAGEFSDVTREAGLIEPIASEAAAWGDYDSDGYVDLFVAGEYRSPDIEVEETARPDLRNRCRLYHNEKNGSFREVAGAAGVENLECAKGAAWGDIDDDGDLDLFVGNLNAPSRLYRNDGNGRFLDVAEELGVVAPIRAASCWFWDFDNDGRLDLFVNDDGGSVGELVSARLGLPVESSHRPRLYRNVGKEGFVEVGGEAGLDRVHLPLSGNFADLDNDGYLDLYIAGGFKGLESYVPSTLLRNVGGKTFEDASALSNASLLLGSHSVAFADHDGDGDLDLFLQGGGTTPGDQAYNRLLRNESPGRHSIQVQLQGKTTNRAALGARIKAAYKTSQGESRTIYRTIGNNSSLGGNSLTESLGLLDAKQVDQLDIQWPVSKTTQVFKNLAADQRVEITEGSDVVKTSRRWKIPKDQP